MRTSPSWLNMLGNIILRRDLCSCFICLTLWRCDSLSKTPDGLNKKLNAQEQGRSKARRGCQAEEYEERNKGARKPEEDSHPTSRGMRRKDIQK